MSPKPNGTLIPRRDLMVAMVGLGSALAGWPAGVAASGRVKPTWLSFGLNVPSSNTSRFPMTEALIKSRSSSRSDFQIEVSQSIANLLRGSGDLVEFKDSVDFGSGLLLGAMLDYENILSARLGASSFQVLHLIGHGVLLSFDQGRGWKMVSGFPFPVTLLRDSAGGDPQIEAQRYLSEAYTDPRNSFATSFVASVKRLSGRWRDTERGFNVRVMSAKVHPDADGKLAMWRIQKNINELWLGHLAGAAVCEGLGIPVVPYQETQGLGRFTYKFNDRLVAQNVRLPGDDDIDLRLHVTLRNTARDVKYRAQFQRWEVTRLVVMDIKAFNDRNEEILSLRCGYQDEQPDTVAREEDISPARDAHFFDMAIYRGLVSLFSSIERKDVQGLSKLFVKTDSDSLRAIENFRSTYQRAI